MIRSYLVMVMSPETDSTGDWLNKWLGDGLLIVNDTISVCILVQDDQFKMINSRWSIHDLLFKIYCSRWSIQDILFMIYCSWYIQLLSGLVTINKRE